MSNIYVEKFLTDDQSNEVTKNVFIGVGTMFLSLIIGGILAWAYYYNDNNQFLFISVLSFFVLLYSLLTMSYTVINKNILDVSTYNIVFGSSIYMIFLIFIVIIIFTIKAFGKQTTVVNQPVSVNEYRNF